MSDTLNLIIAVPNPTERADCYCGRGNVAVDLVVETELDSSRPGLCEDCLRLMYAALESGEVRVERVAAA
jgi:hypothetical protein